MAPHGDAAGLQDISPTVYRDLLHELNKNAAWKKIAKYMVKLDPRISKTWIDRLEQKSSMTVVGQSPAEYLWRELKTLDWDVLMLCHTLRNCELFDALYILAGREDLVITEQPYPAKDGEPYRLRIGNKFCITCKATGIPPPKYQWIFGNNDLPDQTSSTLNLLITSADQEGEYQCRVSHYNRDNERVGYKYSLCAPLTIEPTPVKIIKPLPYQCKVKMGGNLVLRCEAEGHPVPKYHWFKNNTKLNGENSNTLQIKNFQREDKGDYRCFATNITYWDLTSTKVKVDYPRLKPTAKIALLIGNCDYKNEDKLPLAKNDVELMSSILKKLDFHVMCWQNLTLKQMRSAISIFSVALKDGCYGFFYFAGHGFKMNERFLLPVDAPEKYLQADTISEAELLSCCLKKKPKLFVAILDMCLTKPLKELNPEIHEEKCDVVEYECNDNLLIAYSTCNYHPSHERKGAKNGVYMSHLSKYLDNNKSIHKVIKETEYSVRASADSRTQAQKPMHTIIPMEPPRYLTDTVIREISGKPTQYTSYLDELTMFHPTTVQLKIKQHNLTCQATVQLRQPYLNALVVTISGLEDWDVTYQNLAGQQTGLHVNGRNCVIYNLREIVKSNQGSLVIRISKNGTLHALEQFQYMNSVPKMLINLWTMGKFI